MIAAKSLLRLYPAALRDRWGSSLEADVVAAGWRGVPDVLTGAIGIWLHPVVWPADSPGQRRRRAAVMAFVIALTGWLLGHVLVETAPLPRGVAHSALLTGSDLLVVAGLILVAPHPRLGAGAFRRLARRCMRRLVVPAAIGAGVVGWAGFGSGHAAATTRHLVLAIWWAILATGAVQVCRLVADLGEVTAAPPLPRLRLGLAALVVALAGGGLVVLFSVQRPGVHAGLPDALGAALILLTLGCFGTLRDLAECAAAGD